MRDFIRWLKTVRIHRVQFDDVDCYVVADRCGWIPGSSKSRIGVFMIAVRAYRGVA